MTRHRSAQPARRDLLIGLLAVGLSALPLAAYASWTPEGRLIRDRASFTLDPPELTAPSQAAAARLRQLSPAYENAVMPLVYHGIGSGTDGEGDFAISPDRFAEHLASLRAAGMQFVTAAQVAAAFAGGPPLPPNAVLITFDDGRTDALMWATPLLEAAKAKATMFVIADSAAAGGAYYAPWDDLEEVDHVWDIQSHTAALHVEQEVGNGPSLPALTSRAEGESLDDYRRRVKADLDRADAAVDRHTGRAPVAFAYPFGAYGGDERTNDTRLRLALAEELQGRYQLAFHQDGQDGIRLALPTGDRLGVRRLEVGDWTGAELVRRIAACARRTYEVEPGAPPSVTVPEAAVSPS